MYTGMQTRDISAGFFHHPVNYRIRVMASNISHDRQVMDNITERGSLDEEGMHSRRNYTQQLSMLDLVRDLD